MTHDQSSTRNRANLAISEGPIVSNRLETMAGENKSLVNMPNHLECSPITITDDHTSSFGSPGSPDLKKYIENPANDMNWLMTDKVVKRDTSFEEEVKTCRKQFLIETMTDFILNELISELKTEDIYFKKFPKREEQRINVQLLDDPRYVTESSDEETIYGIRTNMNAVYEYCNLLVRFILDNYLDLLLEKFNHKRVKYSNEVLGQIREREVLLALPGNQWKEIGKLKEYLKPKENFFPEFIFESLEQEIIVDEFHVEQLQQHEHHAEPVRHAEGVPQVDLRLHKRGDNGALAGRHGLRRVQGGGAQQGVQKQATDNARRSGRPDRHLQGHRRRVQHHDVRRHPRQRRLPPGQPEDHARRPHRTHPRRPAFSFSLF
jgi:hypothetical protein